MIRLPQTQIGAGMLPEAGRLTVSADRRQGQVHQRGDELGGLKGEASHILLEHGFQAGELTVQGVPGGFPHYAVGEEVSLPLKGLDRIGGGGAEYAVHRQRGDDLIKFSQYGQHVLEDLNLGAGVPLSEDARVLELDLIEGLPFADQLREPGDAHIEVDQLIPGGLSHHAV